MFKSKDKNYEVLDDGDAKPTTIVVNNDEGEEAPPGRSISLWRLLFTVVPDQWPRVVLGIFAGIVNGGIMPTFSILFGNLFDSFNGQTPDEIMDEISKWAVAFLILGIISFILQFVQTSSFAVASEKIAHTLRLRLYNSLLAKDVEFFDKQNSGNLTSRLTTEMGSIQTGCSEKVGFFIQNFSQTIIGLCVALFYGWEMTLVLLSVSPLLMISMGFMMAFMQRSARGTSNDFAAANAIATEVLSGYRTVLAFGHEEHEMERYRQSLLPARTGGIARAFVNGLGMGSTLLFMFGTYSLGFWYGGTLVQAREMAVGDELTVFFCVIMGAMGLGQGMAQVPDITKGSAAAGTIYDLIETPSEIHEETHSRGTTLTAAPGARSGTVEFEDVHFRYPSRPENPVLNGLSFRVESGKVVALVGSSGGGKSTILQLLLRFYDPAQGRVLVNGLDVKSVNILSLRGAMGLVSQEPTLFSGTIRDNIRYGNLDATDEQIEEAARAANAHAFILEQQDRYDTLVGERGTQLSGGQKQRIAIARAILKNPAFLLLDEATSALDATSEHLVQDALNRLMRNRTTIVIAHRLSTIQSADQICFLHQGRIVEVGSHAELMERRGYYFRLVQRQYWTAEDFSQAAEKQMAKDANPPTYVVDEDDQDQDLI